MAAIHPDQGRFILEDVHTGEILDLDLIVHNPKITFQLSGPTVISGSLPLDTYDLKQLGIEAWACYLSYEENGTILATGILQPSDIDANGRMAVEAEGPSSYLHGIPWTGDYSGVKVDPLDVTRIIWKHVQDKYFGDIRVDVDQDTHTDVTIGTEERDVSFEAKTGDMVTDPDNPEGPKIPDTEQVSFKAGPYRLSWWEFTDCGKEVDKLAKNTPFDYMEEAQWSDDKTKIDRSIKFGYPRFGRKRNDLRFAGGENIISAIPLVEADGQYANQIIVSGAGEGRDMVWDTASSTPPRNRLRRVKVFNDKTLKTKADCKAMAKRELDAAMLVRSVKKITVDGTHPNAPFGAFSCGDDVLVQGDLPWIGDIALWHRIVKYDYDVQNSHITMDLERSDSFRYGYHGDGSVTTGGKQEYEWFDIDADSGLEAQVQARAIAFQRNDVYQAVQKPNYGFDLSLSTTAQGMFTNWASVTGVDIRDTESVMDMSYMFSGCSSMAQAPDMNTSSVLTVAHMFERCMDLEYVPEYDVSHVTDFTKMLEGCVSLKSVRMTGMRYSFSVAGTRMSDTSLNDLFRGLGQATTGATIDVTGTPGASTCSPAIASAKGWLITGVPFEWVPITAKGGDQARTQARNAAGSRGVDYKTAEELYFGFDLSSATSARGLLDGWASLTSVQIRGASGITDATDMFRGCASLLNTPAGWYLPNVRSMNGMFDGCSSLTAISGGINANDVNSMKNTFRDCTSLTSIDITNIGCTFSIEGASLDKSALESLYSSLDRVSSKTIDVSNNPGAPTANASIATGKGWNVRRNQGYTVFDNFNRSNGSLGSNWITTGYEPKIINDRVHCYQDVNGGGNAMWFDEMTSDDVEVDVKVEHVGGGSARSGIYLGIEPDGTDWRSYVGLTFDDDNWTLYKKVNGARTTLGSGSWNLTTNQHVSLKRTGTTIRVEKAGSYVTAEYGESTVTGPGTRHVGLSMDCDYSWPFYFYSPQFDDFKAQ